MTDYPIRVTPESTTSGGGWCIHGVPFGPNWTCAQCQTVYPTNVPGAYAVAPIAWTPDKVDRLFFLLDRIVKELESARLRR